MALKWYGDEVKRDVEAHIKGRMVVAGEIIIKEIQQGMRSGKHGAEVPTENKPAGWVTRRSAPGETPAIQTAQLLQSVAQEPIDGGLGVRVGTNNKVGLWMETGTRGGKIIKPKKAKKLTWVGSGGNWISAKQIVQGPILPRPWLRPALRKQQRNIERLLGAPITGKGNV